MTTCLEQLTLPDCEEAMLGLIQGMTTCQELLAFACHKYKEFL
jgi:hypothetical protein